MKNLLKSILVAAFLMVAVTTMNAQLVHAYPSTTITSTASDGTVYFTYPSALKYNYVGYLTINVDTLTYTDSTLLIHQIQVSLDNSTWFDYAAADTLIKYGDVAEVDEDYTFLVMPWKFVRSKFTQSDTATTDLTGYMLLKKQY